MTPDRALGAAGLGASAALGHRGRRQRRPAALADAARDLAARRSPRPRPSGSRRCRCSPCSSIRWCRPGEERLDWLDGVRRLDLVAARAAAGRRPGRDLGASRRPERPRRGTCARTPAMVAERARRCSRRWRPRSTAASGPCRPARGAPRGGVALAGDGAWSRPGGPRRGRAARRRSKRRRGRGRSAPRAGELPAMLERLMARGGGAAALRAASADLHLGPDRGAAPACRSDGPRRPQRGRLAGAARARSLAGAAAPRTSSACRRWSGGSGSPRTISPARSARRRCWSPGRGATRARRRSPRASGCGWRR